jgi:putative sigma-54 modulation protein
MMKVNVTFRHMEPDEALKEYVEEKLTHLGDKYFQRPKDAAVVFSAEKFRRIAEITIKVDNTLLNGREEKDDARVAFDLALDKLEIQAKKYRGKFKVRKRAGAEAGAPEGEPLPPEGPEDDEFIPRVIPDKNYVPKPLTVEDALLALDESPEAFLVFRNSDTNGVCVLYHREDGNYGLIETKG